MLRKLLLLLALVVLVAIALVWQGYIEVPGRAEDGKYEVKVNPPEVGTTTVEVPVVRPSRNEQQGAPAPAPAPANGQ